MRQNGRNHRKIEAHATELALRVYREERHAVLPASRSLVAALTCLALGVVALLSSGCTIGQTRFALGASLVADAATTQSAISSSSATEGNPVLQKAPVPIMLVLSGIVSLVAEHEYKNGHETKAKTLYRVASAVHGVAALWNGYQMGQTNGSAPAGGVAARPAVALTAGSSGRHFGPSIRSNY